MKGEVRSSRGKGIRRAFCDGLAGFSRCRSKSRTCLMELEPFWKFDRREQPGSRFPPPLSYSLLFFLIPFSTILFSLFAGITANFDLISHPSVSFFFIPPSFFLPNYVVAVIVEAVIFRKRVRQYYLVISCYID